MRTQYLFSSSEEDFSLDEKTLDRAFLLNPFEAHPFLTLRNYFQSIERFILERVEDLGRKSNAPLSSDRIEEIVIRSEKHGTLYHVASVELLGDGLRRKFAVSTAFSEPKMKALLHEFETMGVLGRNFRYPYLPSVYLAEKVPCSNPKGTETILMCASEWMEGYHEWHLTADQDGEQSVLIWDMEKGNRRASREESHALFREASKILTLYYDTKTYRQIYPWHHAAGDFVVKSVGKTIDVRLTTARNYLPLISFPKKADTNRVTALVAFLLNMAVQMRLDKLGGVGEPVWAQEEFVRPSLEGFFGALRIMKAEGRHDLGQGPDLPTLLKKFSREELQRLYAPLMESYREEKPADFMVVEKNLEGHIFTLWGALQAFDEGGLQGTS
jgi:hypothetical protein